MEIETTNRNVLERLYELRAEISTTLIALEKVRDFSADGCDQAEHSIKLSLYASALCRVNELIDLCWGE